MKLHFSIKNYEVQISSRVHYEVLIYQDSRKENLREIAETPRTRHMSYLGAYLHGWKQARLYAQFDGCNHSFMVFRVTKPDTIYIGEMMCCRTIQVSKQVAFFSK